MNCQEFWDILPELEGPQDGPEFAHLRECPVCSAVMKNQRHLATGLRLLASEDRRVKAPARIEGKLLAAFRGQTGVAETPRRHSWWYPVGAWASAALVVASAFLMFAPHNAQLPKTASAGADLSSITWTAGLPVDKSADAATGEFVPLPNADRLPPNEDLNLVRVEVPRSAMIALGYSVTADRAQERVRADVVLGSDGLARAVRFLDE